MARPKALDIFIHAVEVLDQVPALHEAVEALNEVFFDHAESWEDTITDAEQNNLLRALTGYVVTLDTDLSCYPLGATTTILFDANGDPV